MPFGPPFPPRSFMISDAWNRRSADEGRAALPWVVGATVGPVMSAIMSGMKIFRTIIAVLALSSVALATSACPQEGPAEKAGKKVDKAIDKTKDAAKDATK
jgi:hypothetical protein